MRNVVATTYHIEHTGFHVDHTFTAIHDPQYLSCFDQKDYLRMTPEIQQLLLPTVRPVDPIHPVHPVNPVKPIDPVIPGHPAIRPSHPVKPIDPVKPVDPIDPVKPIDPVTKFPPGKPTLVVGTPGSVMEGTKEIKGRLEGSRSTHQPVVWSSHAGVSIGSNYLHRIQPVIPLSPVLIPSVSNDRTERSEESEDEE